MNYLNNKYYYHIKFVLNKELSQIYSFFVIRSFALSMINIFIPVFLYNLGYGLKEISLFFLISFFTFGASCPLTAKIAAKIGLKRSMLVSIPFTIIYFFLLKLVGDNVIFYLLPAIIDGVHMSLFWTPFHLCFVKHSSDGHMTKEIGWLRSLSMFVGIIGPVIGGFILVKFDFDILFLLISFLLFTSIIPLFFSKEIYEPALFSRRYIFNKNHLKYFFLFFNSGILGVVGGIFWPLYIFLILKGFISLGVIISVATIFTSLYILFIGKLGDIIKLKKIIVVGSIGYSIIWIARIFAKNLISLFSLGILGEVFFNTLDLPFNSEFYKIAKKDLLVEFFIYREIALNLGRIFILSLVFYFSSIPLSFVVASISSLVFLFS